MACEHYLFKPIFSTMRGHSVLHFIVIIIDKTVSKLEGRRLFVEHLIGYRKPCKVRSADCK